MPVLDFPINETVTHIFEPIQDQMVQNILTNLGVWGILKENIRTDTDYMKGTNTWDDNDNIRLQGDKAIIKVEYNLNPAEMIFGENDFRFSQAYGVVGSNKRSVSPIFCDEAVGVRMNEFVEPCVLTFNFQLYFRAKEHAYLANSALKKMCSGNAIVRPYVLAYDYPLDFQMATALDAIYRLRTSENATLSFYQYLTTYSSNVVDFNVSSADENMKEIVFKRVEVNALGRIEYQQPRPEVQLENQAVERTLVEFTFVLQFGRPDAMQLYFPITIENQLIPSDFVTPIQTNDQYNWLVGALRENSLNGALRTLSGNTAIPLYCQTPDYDDWRLPSLSPLSSVKTQLMLIAGFTVTPNEPSTIDLTNLVDFQLNPTVIAMMKANYTTLLQTSSLFIVSVFANDVQVDQSLLSIDENLLLTVNMDNTLKRYHLVISELTDFQKLDPSWVGTLIQYRTFFPVSIIRNLQWMIDRKIYYISNTNRLLQVVAQLFRRNAIDGEIATLIANGHASPYAYSFATTQEQWCDYLMVVKSPVSGKLLYDEFVAQLILENVLTEADLPTGYYRTASGWPVLSDHGGIHGTNTPLRVFSTTILV